MGAPNRIFQNQEQRKHPPRRQDPRERNSGHSDASPRMGPRILRSFSITSKAGKSGICGVPGGCIAYTLMNRLPGVSLHDRFWTLEHEGRDDVREAFKRAYMYGSSRSLFYCPQADMRTASDCVNCGVVSYDRGVHNLLWDQETRGTYCTHLRMLIKIYIYIHVFSLERILYLYRLPNNY